MPPKKAPKLFESVYFFRKWSANGKSLGPTGTIPDISLMKGIGILRGVPDSRAPNHLVKMMDFKSGSILLIYQNPGYLLCIEGYTIQLYRYYNRPF